MKQRSAPQLRRKRKFFLVLPLLALPFITLAFWAMGGGRGNVDETKSNPGLNLQLPDARLKDDKNFDKLSFYNQAEKDSLQHQEALKMDPGYKPDTGMNVLQLIRPGDGMMTSPFSNNGIDVNEQKIYKKISELNQQINKPAEKQKPSAGNISEQFTSEVDKLQSMMKMMNDKTEKDPEMEQIGGMLDKILDIQHPERIKVKENSIKNKEQVFTVQSNLKSDNISLMQSGQKDSSGKRKAHNNFYDFNKNPGDKPIEENAIEAVVHQSQTVVSGSTVKLRLVNDIYVNGISIPNGSFIYGVASLENERLSIAIKTIRYLNNLFPVALEVYDLDGLAGIHIPGSISRDAAKQSADQGLQNIEITALDPSIAAQAANTGIQAAKNLLAKKSKLVKVTVKAGYKILLKDNNKQ